MNGLVLSAGGARGADQAGVLRRVAEIRPDLPFPILAGSSVGSLTAPCVASRADRFAEAVASLQPLWAELTVERIYRTDAVSLSGTGLRWLRDLVGGGRVTRTRARCLLDTAPLGQLLREQVEFRDLQPLIERGIVVHAVAVTATSDNRARFTARDGRREPKGGATVMDPTRCAPGPPVGEGVGDRTGSSALKVERSTDGRHTASVRETVELLDGGEQAYPRMLRAIAQAQRRVHLEVYGFAPSGVGARFVDALGHAASRGVSVQVLIDGWGSARGGRAVAAALREAGCAVRIYNRLRALLVGRLVRNHRKLLLVDDEVAFLGGINIGDENVGEGVRLGWADVAVEIRGPQCARLGQMIRHEPGRAVESALRIHVCGLGGGWRLRRRYLKAFARARRRIDVAHGYFLPDRGVVRAITAAARRGVQVCLLLAGRSDIPFARAATRSLYRRLLAAGVSIHEWDDSVLHAKVATVDGRRLLVGSFNLDPFSLSNLEALVEVADPQVAEQAEAWIQDHFARSRPVTSLEACSRVQGWLLDPLGRLVARLAEAISRVMASRRRRRASPDWGLSSRTPPPEGPEADGQQSNR